MDNTLIKQEIAQPLDFFDEARSNFFAAIAQAGEVTRFYQLAGFTFCLKFAGDLLVKTLTEALEHLEVQKAETPDLTICIWDSASTGTRPLEYPWPTYYQQSRGEVFGYNNDRFYSVVDVHTKVLHLLDKERREALYWIKDGRDLSWWIGGSPFQLILHWWMRLQGYQLTHAAAVGSLKGGVLIAGKSGSGKSTTTLACMRAGMQYVSEDYCILSDLPNLCAYSVYNSAKLMEKTLQWFPELKHYVKNPHRAKEDKAFLFHHQFQPHKILLKCPLKALITLKIENTQESSWLEPIDLQGILSALSISTMWQLTHTGPSVFKHMKRIAEALPAYQLHIGGDLMQVPQLIGSLL